MLMTSFRFTGLLSGLLIYAGMVQAQDLKSSEEVSTGQQLLQAFGTSQLVTNDPVPTNANQVLLTQQGNNNVNTINQTLLNAGRGNLAAVVQNGNNNAAGVLQQGAANRTIITQIGNNNAVTSSLTGYNTEATILQDGNRNFINQQLIRDNERYSVEQFGNNNSLVQRETAGSTPGYNVTMRGNGIQIMIEQGRVNRLP